MRYATTTGKFVSAPTRTEAESIARQYGMGELAEQSAPPPKPRKAMTLATAVRLYSQADEWPRCGQQWPMTAREREADRLLLIHGYPD